MDRIDGYLSRIIQSEWRDALVMCMDDRDWIIRRPGHPDLGLGETFGQANQAVHALLRAERAKSK